MLDYNERGHEGEEQACLFLAARNYRILARNWRSHHHEIDIIADQYGELVFVEVKARRNENYLPAVAAVDDEKRRNVREAAKHYMNLHRFDGPYRFDIITVVGEEKPYRFQHFVAAF